MSRGHATFVLGQRGVADTMHLGAPRGPSLPSGQVGGQRPMEQQPPPRRGGFASAAASSTFEDAPFSPPRQALRPSSQQLRAQQAEMQQRLSVPHGVPAPTQQGGPRAGRPPSVSFSELEGFANHSKLRAANDHDLDAAGPADGAYQYMIEGDEGDLTDEDDGDHLDEHAAMRKAAHLAADVQEDNHFAFMNGSGGADEFDFGGVEGEPTVPDSRQRRRVHFGKDQVASTEHGNCDHLFGGETAAQTRERIRLIAKLKRKNAKKPEDQRESIDESAPLEVLRRMTMGTTYETKAELTVLMMRRGLVFLAKLVEQMAKRFPRYFGDLDGWADNLYLSLDQYNELLFEVYDAYFDNVQANPLVTLIFALGSNAVMYAMTKKLVNNPATGQVLSGLADAFRNNANARNAAVAGAAGPPEARRAPPRAAGEGPAAPISASAPAWHASGPLGSIVSMFGGQGGQDLNQILSSLGDMFSGAGGGPNMARSSDITEAELVNDIEDYGPDPAFPRDLRGEGIPHVDTSAMTGPDDAENLLNSLRMDEDSLEQQRVVSALNEAARVQRNGTPGASMPTITEEELLDRAARLQPPLETDASEPGVRVVPEGLDSKLARRRKQGVVRLSD